MGHGVRSGTASPRVEKLQQPRGDPAVQGADDVGVLQRRVPVGAVLQSAREAAFLATLDRRLEAQRGEAITTVMLAQDDV